MANYINSVAELRDTIGDEIPGLSDKNIDYLDDFAVDFIGVCPFVILSSSDANGRVDSSPKGDGAGFVKIVDTKTLLIPDRPGNKLAYGHQNILENPQVGLLFVIPGTNETLRVNGTAKLRTDSDTLNLMSARGKAALLAVEVTVQECFFHCGKAFLRSKLWQPTEWPERYNVSFGEMYAQRMKAGADVAKVIDDAIDNDYRDNL
ncbi:MAG: PPOX class probable FMN-dependent enzyme [Candidatus Azotimanducaceae bacterium]|jgi:PPOX class probable FMN-dependent enzyme